MYMPARHDTYVNQAGDGYVAHLAGLEVSTDAQASRYGGKGIGTVPHSLIAAFDGNTVEAAKAFARKYGDETNVSVLVDFENDCSRTAVEVADALKAEGLPLWGVRLDTSERLVDKGVQMIHGNMTSVRGVCLELTHMVRGRLNAAGHPDVKIIVSGGFTPDKISQFERYQAAVDAYGVGSSLLRGSNDFTADIVKVNGRPCAKVGRYEIPSERLETII
jgi:nicotinate phosphoribosyltransferase